MTDHSPPQSRATKRRRCGSPSYLDATLPKAVFDPTSNVVSTNFEADAFSLWSSSSGPSTAIESVQIQRVWQYNQNQQTPYSAEPSRPFEQQVVTLPVPSRCIATTQAPFIPHYDEATSRPRHDMGTTTTDPYSMQILSPHPVPLITPQPSSQYNQDFLMTTCSWTEMPQPQQYRINDLNRVSSSMQMLQEQGQPQHDTHEQIVCFGMATGIAGTCRLSPSTQVHEFSVRLEHSRNFHGIDDSSVTGEVGTSFVHLTGALLDEAELDLEVTCGVDTPEPSKTSRSGNRNRPLLTMRKCVLEIVIYGPLKLFDDVGSFFQEHDVYLQDPLNCRRKLPYHNPHRLPDNSGRILLTCELAKQHSHVVVEDESNRPDLLDVLTSQEDLAETEQPRSIRTILKKHQQQALTFMLNREQGWAWDGSRADIWEFCEDSREPYFINRVSSAVQTEAPLQFYGGIIADPMGLGKTLSMIALIAFDLCIDRADPSSISGANDEESSGRTLIVVPPPLLITWEHELETHVFPNSLPWCCHHGKSRLNQTDLESFIIVLTTYHTVSAEWKNQNTRASSVLFKTRWRRVVLDEAHAIRNSESQMARAICSLDSVSRWAITGTPIQNRLSDLATLLKFLKVYPYSEKRAFETDISHLWKAGNRSEAIKRLERLSGCVLLRRPKAIIQLPPKHDVQYFVDLSIEERRLYEEIRLQTASHIDQVLSRRDNATALHSFVNVLQRIEAMRMVCNLGLYYPYRNEVSKYNQQFSENWQQLAQRTFNLRREIGTVQCRICSCPADTSDDRLNEVAGVQQAKALFSRCWEFVCSSCATHCSTAEAATCGAHSPPCLVATVSTDDVFGSDEPSDLFSSQMWRDSTARLPTKVSMLLDDLQAQPRDVKCVVFSMWRRTLDVIEVGLKQASIACLRFDGKVLQRERQGVVERFRKDPTIRVLLLTLSCGAVGLTLTEASRAYLMEPNWNPTIEDQALARIHRIGQIRQVNTIRFIVRDSFEQRVVELQKSKRDLAGILLNRHSGEDGQDNTAIKPLEWLRGLI